MINHYFTSRFTAIFKVIQPIMRNPISFLIFLFILLAFSLRAQQPSLIIPQSHSFILTQIQFSEDGKLIYTTTFDGSTKIWEAATGNLFHTLYGNPSILVPFTLDIRSQYLAIGSEFSIAQLWDLRNGKPIRTFSGEYSLGLQFALSPDGQTFLYGDETGLVEAKSIATGRLVATKKRHTRDILKLGYSNDGKYVFSLGGEDSLKVWQANNWQLIAQLGGLEIDDRTVQFIDTKQQVVFGGTSGKVYAWDFLSNNLQNLGKHQRELLSLSTSLDGQFILSNSEDQSLRLWDLKNQALVFTKQEAGLISTRISKNGKHLIGGYENGQLKCWDIQSQQELWSKQAHSTALNLLQFSPNGQYIISGSASEEGSPAVFLWETANGKQIQKLDGASKIVGSLSLSPNQRYLITGREDGYINIWDQGNGQLWRSIKAHKDKVRSIDIAPNGSQFISTGEDSVIKVWDLYEGKLRQTLAGPEKRMNIIRFSPDGQTIMSIGREKQAFVWNLQNNEAYPIGNARSSYTSFEFSPDSKLFITTSFEGIAQVWDVQNKTLVQSLLHSASPLKAAVFSPSGRMAITLSGDGTTKYWDLQTGQTVKTMSTPMDFINKAVFSEDRTLLFMSDEDAISSLWDLKSGKLQHTFTGHNKEILDAKFSADAKYLITTSFDNTTKFWDLESGKEKGTLVSLQENDWVLTNPEGLFDASNAALNTMHYVVNDQNRWESIDIQQLKTRYYEPGLLAKITGLSNERIRPVSVFEEVALYPEVVQHEIKNDQVRIKLKPRSGGLGKVPIFINGKEVSADANPLPRGGNAQRSKEIQFDLKPYQKFLLQHPDSTNYIQFVAYNEGAWLKSKTFQLPYKAAQSRGNNNGSNTAWKGSLDPKLYVVAIGTSNYNGDQLDLKYADQDATLMAKSMSTVGATLFTNGDSLEVHCLTTASADSTGLENTAIHWQFSDKKNIQNTLKSIQERAKAEDILMVYFSGHGVTYGGAEQSQFHYLTQGIGSEDLSDEEVRKAYTISSDELTDWINAVPALKQVLVIDACNSGQIVNNLSGAAKNLSSSQIRALDRMQDRTGMFVLSGSAADKVSYEASAYGQGLLTYALLQGMRGLGTRKTADGEAVDVMQLFQYARDEVPRLAATINGVQTPMLGFPNRAASFDLGLLDESAQAKLPFTNAKPIMIRSTFLNQNTLRDDLNLAKKLNEAFRKESEKGRKANLIFVDVESYPGAYNLGGLYTLDRELIKLQLKLLQTNESIDLVVSATDKPDRLVKMILRAVYQKIK